MKTWFQTTTTVALMILLMLGAAQIKADITQDPLDKIRNKVEVLDYSEENPWGNLPDDVGAAVQNGDFPQTDEWIGKSAIESLADLKEYQKAFVTRKTLPQIAGGEGMTPQEASNAFAEVLGNAVGADNVNAVLIAAQTFGEAQINAAILDVANFMRNILASLAILWIVASGIRMAMAGGDETKTKEQIHAILWGVLGLGLVLIAERLIAIIYGAPGAAPTDLTQLPTGISDEVAGIIRYAKALIGAFAVAMIMVNGVQAVFSGGDEEKLKHARQSVVWVVAGLILILVNEVFIRNLYINPVERGLANLDPSTGIPISEDKLGLADVSQTIGAIGTIIKFALSFAGLIAFAAAVYGGATMVMNLGNEEMTTKGKTILINAILGILILIASFALISTVIL